MKSRFLLLALAFSLIYACDTDSHPRGWQPLNLMEYGAPVSVLAPTKAEVKKGKMESKLVNDLSIYGGDNYQIQLFYAVAITNDIARIKNDQMEIVKTNRYFHRIVREDVAGFIYEMRMDTVPNYGFQFIKLQGDTELTFQSGMNKIFELEDIEMMYDAVK